MAEWFFRPKSKAEVERDPGWGFLETVHAKGLENVEMAARKRRRV